MRILLLTQYFPPEVGAPQTRLRSILDQLVRLGHAVETVTAMPNYPTGRIFPPYRGRLYRRERFRGATVHRVWLFAAKGTGLARLANYLSFTVTALLGLLRCKRPDLLLVESPPLTLSVPAWLASLAWRCPFHFYVADLWPDSAEAMGALGPGWLLSCAQALETWTYRRARSVVAITEGIRATLQERKAVPSHKITFLPNGVDTDLFHPCPPDPEFARAMGLAGRRVVLYAGTLGLAQGLGVALDAVARIGRRDPRILLVLAGDGSERAALEAKARRDGNGFVTFLDALPLDQVPRLFALAEIGLVMLRDLPLFDGARPSKLFPVMASGKPVVYSGAGEGARLVMRIGAGACARPGSVEDLERALLSLLDDPARAQACGARGRQAAVAEFGWPGLVQAWLDQVENLDEVPGRS